MRLNPNSHSAVIAAVVVLAVLIVILYSVLSYGFSGGEHVGGHYNFTVGIGVHSNQSSIDRAMASNVLYFRTDISLNPQQEEALSEEHSTHGAHYLGILDYDTLPGGFSDDNWSLGEWNESVLAAVKAYPWIDTWEIWNEPWVPSFQKGFMNGSAYNYYLMTKSAYTIIKSIEPNATVVCFGGAPIGSATIYAWYSEVWGYGASGYCNAISLHIYPSSASVLNSSTANEWSQWISQYESMTGKPIWITEFGMPSSSNVSAGYSQANQMEFMVQAFNLFNKYPYIKRAYWYDLWGLSDGYAGNDFGILNISDPLYGKPSRAWNAFLSVYNRSLSKG